MWPKKPLAMGQIFTSVAIFLSKIDWNTNSDLSLLLRKPPKKTSHGGTLVRHGGSSDRGEIDPFSSACVACSARVGAASMAGDCCSAALLLHRTSCQTRAADNTLAGPALRSVGTSVDSGWDGSKR